MPFRNGPAPLDGGRRSKAMRSARSFPETRLSRGRLQVEIRWLKALSL